MCSSIILQASLLSYNMPWDHRSWWTGYLEIYNQSYTIWKYLRFVAAAYLKLSNLQLSQIKIAF